MAKRQPRSAAAIPVAPITPPIPAATGAVRLRLVLRALRPHQWSKNALLFVPQLLAHQVFAWDKWLASGTAFLCFCLGASSVYLINDVIDIEADRAHPQKRNRPFASGLLPVSLGYRLAPAMAFTSVSIALALMPATFAAALLLYLATSLLYSTFLNRRPVLDILVLAGLYALRIFAGSRVTNVAASSWLLGFSLFFFLSLAFLKRYVELVNLRDSNQMHRSRAGYVASDLVLLLSGGLSCGYVSVLVFALYSYSPDTATLYRHPLMLSFICPVLLYWINRVWFVAHRGAMNYDPVVYALRDRVSIALGVICVALVAAGTF